MFVYLAALLTFGFYLSAVPVKFALILRAASRPGFGTSVRVSIPYRQTDDMHLGSPRPRYRASGMSTVLTELSVVLDKKYYNRRYFD